VHHAVGLRGSYWKLLTKLAVVLAFNAAVLAVLAVIPSWIGHISLQVRHGTLSVCYSVVG
jgi:hypothetical protein